MLPLFLRLFEMFDFSRSFGVILICTMRMVTNLVQWLAPMLLLDLAFSAAFTILAPTYEAENSGGPIRSLYFSSIDWSTVRRPRRASLIASGLPLDDLWIAY